MIAEYKLYHGAVIADVIDRYGKETRIRCLDGEGRLLNYSLNGAVGLQIKYATQRLRPWHFTFPKSHLVGLEDLSRVHASAFLVLVCRTDGILAVEAKEIMPLLKGADGAQSWLRADRKKREMYRLYGPDGEFSTKIGTNVDPIVDALRRVEGYEGDRLNT